MDAVRLEFRFETGLVARCRAAHAPAFRESLAVETADRTLWADSVGLLRTPPLPWGLLRAGYEGRALAEAASRRLRRRRSELARAFERQLDAFARAVRHPAARSDGADAASGLRGLEVLTACRASLERGGDWVNPGRPVGRTA